MKFFAALLLSIPFSPACKKKDNKPEEYFSVDAKGVYHHYPSETMPVGHFRGREAGARLGHLIYTYSQKGAAMRSKIRPPFAGNGLSNKDTFKLGSDLHNINKEVFRDHGLFYERWQRGETVFHRTIY